MQQLPLGGTDSVTGSTYLPAPQLVPFYQKMFSLYGNTSGTPLAVLGCPFDVGGGSRRLLTTETVAQIARASRIQAVVTEQVQTVRIDYNINEKNTTWYRFQTDNGLQAAYTDPINPLFNALPAALVLVCSGVYARLFQNLVNYFNPAFSSYGTLFLVRKDFQKTLAAFPIVLQGSGANAPFTTVGGLDNTWVQGRRASGFLSTTTLNGAMAPTNCALERILASCG